MMMLSVGSRVGAGRLAHDDPPAGQPLADIVVGVALEVERHAVRQERAEALPAVPVKRTQIVSSGRPAWP